MQFNLQPGASRHTICQIICTSTASHHISLVQVQAVRPQADWYLFGGADCHTGKTFACVVGAVACQEWHLICFCLTSTCHVKDLRDEMISYLGMRTLAVDPSDNTVYSANMTSVKWHAYMLHMRFVQARGAHKTSCQSFGVQEAAHMHQAS